MAEEIPSDTYFTHINCIVPFRRLGETTRGNTAGASLSGAQTVVQLCKYKTKNADAIGALISK